VPRWSGNKLEQVDKPPQGYKSGQVDKLAPESRLGRVDRSAPKSRLGQADRSAPKSTTGPAKKGKSAGEGTIHLRNACTSEVPLFAVPLPSQTSFLETRAVPQHQVTFKHVRYL